MFRKDGTKLVEGHKVFPLTTSFLEHLRSVLVVPSRIVTVYWLLFLVVLLFTMLYPCHCLVSQSLVIIVVHPLSTDLIT